MARSAVAAVALVLVAGALVACAGKDTVTNEDRVLVEYQRQIIAKAHIVAAGLTGNAPEAAAALSELMGDADRIVVQLQKNWGKPKTEPPPYTPDNLAKAIAASEKSHTAWWMVISGVVTGFLVALGVAEKVARFVPIPGLSSALSLGRVMAEGAERFMERAKAGGQEGVASSLATELEIAQKDAKIKGLAEKVHKSIKKKLGIPDRPKPPVPLPKAEQPAGGSSTS